MDVSEDGCDIHYKVMGVSHHASLKEVDDRYLELVMIWSGPNHPGDDEFAAKQVRVIDEAYGSILKRLMRYDRIDKKQKKPTIQNIVAAQDKILVPGESQEDYWIHADKPPRCELTGHYLESLTHLSDP